MNMIDVEAAHAARPGAAPIAAAADPRDLVRAIAAIDWTRVGRDLDDQGWATIPGLLRPTDCAGLRALAADHGADARVFRSRVVMQRHGFGRGEYRYFAYPLPPLVERLRTLLYPALAAQANRWNERLGAATRFPDAHAEFIARCHAAGQLRPTPLLLQYGPGDYNCLHQDLYVPLVFPLQLVCLLARPGDDFSGGELVLTEQRPRQQSRASVVPLAQGDAVVFAVSQRPVQGARGTTRVTMRHGVSALRSGQRHSLGVIFHDAL
jgi:hypothetical protein